MRGSVISMTAMKSPWIIAFGVMTAAPGLVVMQCVFTATSAVGVWRWLIAPRRAQSVAVA